YIFDHFTNGDVISDNCYAGGDNPNNFQLDEFTTTPINGNVERDWRYLYEGISRANAVLDNTEAISSPDLSELRKAEILGEAAFLRAYHYFNLVNLYGSVPLVLEKVNSTDPEVIYQPQASSEEIYVSIIADLEYALNRVSSDVGSAEQVNQGSVSALLAKAYAHRPNPDWSLVDFYAEALVGNSSFGLLSSFDMLWNGQNENSVESIFEVPYLGGTNEASWGPQLFLPPSLTGDSWRKFNTPSNDLIATYQAEGDQIRLQASILFENNLPWSDPNFPDGNVPFPFKLRKADGWSSGSNVILLRLADIMILQAEAKVELGALAAAAALLNQVRDRVNLPAISVGSAEELRVAIAKERRLELAFEGHRWFDLKRTGQAVEIMNALNLGYNVTREKLVFPIPQSELDRNPNLVQNPSY
ncbi:MAG: RagB/SusD family nutrient uptake outer membrane protein, partial [Bacteroidota bacterium]